MEVSAFETVGPRDEYVSIKAALNRVRDNTFRVVLKKLVAFILRRMLVFSMQ